MICNSILSGRLNITWDNDAIADLESEFRNRSLLLTASYKDLTAEHKDILVASVLTDEAIATSRIENKSVDRGNVRSWMRSRLGLSFENTENRRMNGRINP